MKAQKWKTYLVYIFGTVAVGALAALLTREGTRLYTSTMSKPPLSPPALLFPIVWSVLYVLMGFGAARVANSEASARKKRALYVYAAQLAVNFLWSLVFFDYFAYGAAFGLILVLLVLIGWMIFSFGKIDALAAGVQVPYFLWVSFAAYLNAGVWALNR